MTRRRGTTLIEVVVVIALMAVIAGVATPAFQSLTRPAEPTAAQGVMAVLRSARTHAVERGEHVTVTIDPATARFWLDHPDTSGTIALPAGATLSGAVRVHFRFAPSGVTSFEPLFVQENGVLRRVAVDRWSGEGVTDAR